MFLEGEAGVGKTEVAKVLSGGLGFPLIRLQCYEGLDSASALYEWNYPKQLLAIRRFESSAPEAVPDVFTEEYLIPRPLLNAIRSGTREKRVVLLIDELDRADEEFEAFLMEVLSDFTISIPELGTLTANARPVVILTSNRTREVHDALKRRCLYHWIEYPSLEKELSIVTAKVPGIGGKLSRQICGFMAEVRKMDFLKKPGVAETLDWARALLLLSRDFLDPDTVDETLGCIFKYEEDLRSIKNKSIELLDKLRD